MLQLDEPMAADAEKKLNQPEGNNSMADENSEDKKSFKYGYSPASLRARRRRDPTLEFNTVLPPEESDTGTDSYDDKSEFTMPTLYLRYFCFQFYLKQ